MKRIWIYLLTICSVSIALSSCSKNSDEEWRDSNMAFYHKVQTMSNVHKIGDQNNGYPGVCYQVLKEGTGTILPIVGNKVKVSYAGWLYSSAINYESTPTLNADDVFDSGSNFQFTVGSGVIEGWSLAIQYMPVGSKWRLFIPYDLAYGRYGSGSIPAYSTLIFDVELKEIVSEN